MRLSCTHFRYYFFPILFDYQQIFGWIAKKDGFIYTLPGKGCYVAPKNVELLREENLKKIEAHIDEIVRLADTCNLSKQDIIDMVNFSLEEQG